MENSFDTTENPKASRKPNNKQQKLNEKIETIFLMSDVENQIISSKFVKEIAKLNGKISKFLTKSTVKKLKNKLEWKEYFLS